MIILPIENQSQQSPNSCWLSVCSQLVSWHKKKHLSQKHLAKWVDDQQGTLKARAGSFDDIVKIVRHHGLQAIKIRPTTLEDLTGWIEGRDPIILQMRTDVTGENASHVVLVRGLVRDEQSGQTMFIINDPLVASAYSLAISPKTIFAHWEAGLVIMAS